MSRRTQKASILTLSGILLLVQYGCTFFFPPAQDSNQRQSSGLSEEMRLHLGTIGVVSTSGLPEAKFEMPPESAFSGAKRGAGVGAYTGASIVGSGGGSGPGAIFLPPAMAASAIAGALIGTVYGALQAEPPDTVEQAEHAFYQALKGLRIQEFFHQEVVKYATRRTKLPVVALSGWGLTTKEPTTNHLGVKQENIDTILEVQVSVLGIKATEYALTPPVVVFMQARARLIRTADNVVFHEDTFEYETEPRPYTEWAADQAILFRKALNSAYRYLAGEIIWTTFIRPQKRLS